MVPDEVIKAFPDMNTSPGPDGLTTRQLKAVPPPILTRIFNLFLICDKLPGYLLKVKTTLIPKKDGAQNPEDYRPITVQSTITRVFHKVLARRLLPLVPLDKRQKAFLPTDGCASMASVDIAKAFDSVSHKTIQDSLLIKGAPSPLVEYIMDTYERSSTVLSCGN